ncbi:MAG TPA: ROK family protein [Beijerinckiaceae bacterium]|jgi:fructokinase
MLIGIDWGGTKIEAIALSEAGETLARTRVATPRDYDRAVTAATRLVHDIERSLGRNGSVGVGIPGALSPSTGLVRNANSVWMNGKPLDRDLARALDRPVRIENDANCFAVSEAIDGAGEGGKVVWGVILGTGAGSGIAIDGRPLSGPHKVAGEWGHNPLPWPRDDERPGPPCFCGKSGCLETFVSGTGFAADHARRTGETLRAEEIVARMRRGDAAASASFDIYLDRLGRGMAHVIHILDPDVIVLGGGMSDVDEIYGQLPARIAPWVLTDAFVTPVRKNRHGASSGVRGAAWLWGRYPSP